MILNNCYIVHPTATFKEELGQITYYIKYKLKEPSFADKLYKKVVQEVEALNFMPERFQIICNFKGIHYRKFLINNYIIIYEVKKDTGQVFLLHIFHSSQNFLNLL